MYLTPYDTAAELSATAADIAANITEDRACPDLIGHARDLLSALTAVLGDGRDRPPVVCLCGSTRFYDEFRRANLRLTLAGEIVLSIGCDTKSDGDLAAAAEFGTGPAAVKTRLDELHKRKIDLADYVLVLNVGGYTGASTRSEIAYAAARGKPVRYLEPPAPDTDEGEDATQYAQEAADDQAWWETVIAMEEAGLLGGSAEQPEARS